MKVGTDIVKVGRIKELDELSLKKIFHPSELKDKDPLHLAGIFAAKECCKKIFSGSDWLDFEIIKNKEGKPLINSKFRFEGDVSISHDGDYAIAVVIAHILENS